MSDDYKWAFDEDGDAIECARCSAEVPLQLFERVRPDPAGDSDTPWLKELLCEVCANSLASGYPKQGTRAEEVALGAANAVLLALFRAGVLVFAERSERQVFVVDDNDHWHEKK